jgi:hypothetical protein
MSWKMYVLSDLQRLSIPDQLFHFSQANLDSAEMLCLAMCGNNQVATYAHGAVIQSLTFHALELFLKAAILRSEPTATFGGPTGHDLTLLYNRYKGLYPEKCMQFDAPFMSGPLDANDLVGLDQNIIDELVKSDRERKKDKVDQLHRYPIDMKGNEWKSLFGFEPNSFGLRIKQIQSDLSAVKAVILND